MSETQKPDALFQDFAQAERYVEDVREHYRNNDAAYKGRRNNDHLQLIVEVTSDEARAIADGVMLGILTLGGIDTIEHPPTDNDEVPIIGGRSWKEFRGAYEHLLVDFGILTYRLHAKGFNVPSYSDMSEGDRLKTASVLFSDFLSHNALRFGVDTAGVPKTERKVRHPEDGGTPIPYYVTSDKDRAISERQVIENIAKKGFRLPGSVHPAGKISPKEYVRLRREFSEKDKDDFDRDVSYLTNVRDVYENQE